MAAGTGITIIIPMRTRFTAHLMAHTGMGLLGHIPIMMIMGINITTTITATIIITTGMATAIIMTRRVNIITIPCTPGIIIIPTITRIIFTARI